MAPDPSHPSGACGGSRRQSHLFLVASYPIVSIYLFQPLPPPSPSIVPVPDSQDVTPQPSLSSCVTSPERQSHLSHLSWLPSLLSIQRAIFAFLSNRASGPHFALVVTPPLFLTLPDCVASFLSPRISPLPYLPNTSFAVVLLSPFLLYPIHSHILPFIRFLISFSAVYKRVSRNVSLAASQPKRGSRC